MRANEVGAVLRLLRRAHGRSQADLAGSLGVDDSYVARIETGRKPSARILSRWVTACPVLVLTVEALVQSLYDLLSADGPYVFGDERLHGTLSKPQLIEAVQTLRFPSALDLAASHWPDTVLDTDAVIWLIYKAAPPAALPEPFSGADAVLGWNRMVEAVSRLPVVSQPDVPRGSDWYRLQSAWPTLSGRDQRLLADLADRLRKPLEPLGAVHAGSAFWASEKSEEP